MMNQELLGAVSIPDPAEVMRMLDKVDSVRGYLGRTALYYAATVGRIEIVRALLDYGADVDGYNNVGYTPLAGAAGYGRLDVVELLLDRGATINLQISQGLTALMVSCTDYRRPSKQPAIVRLLLERGADITATDDYGSTVLMAAARGGQVEVLRAIHFETMDLDAQDEEGNTALHHAAMHRRTEAAEALLAAGANPAIRNQKGQTPYEAGLALWPDEPIDALAPSPA